VYAACGSLIQGHGNDENTERIKPDKANKRPIKLEFSWWRPQCGKTKWKLKLSICLKRKVE